MAEKIEGVYYSPTYRYRDQHLAIIFHTQVPQNDGQAIDAFETVGKWYPQVTELYLEKCERWGPQEWKALEVKWTRNKGVQTLYDDSPEEEPGTLAP